MSASKFDRTAVGELNRRFEMVKTRSFTQDWFLQKNGLDSRFGVCSGLIQVWWASRRNGRDPIPDLRDPDPALVNQVVSRQIRSFYFQHVPAEQSELTSGQIEWLRFKYGMSCLTGIELLCRNYKARTLLELDLVLQHDALIETRHVFEECSSATISALTADHAPGLRLLLIRHFAPDRSMMQRGHRIAFWLNDDGLASLFDTNYGEMAFTGLSRFDEWMHSYWVASGYSARVRQKIAGVHPIQIYRFSNNLRPDGWDSERPADDELLTGVRSAILSGGKRGRKSEPTSVRI